MPFVNLVFDNLERNLQLECAIGICNCLRDYVEKFKW
jgi:hypothetical protein